MAKKLYKIKATVTVTVDAPLTNDYTDQQILESISAKVKDLPGVKFYNIEPLTTEE